ncbi:MAG: KR domain-containing protein [Deltaproteobacteria bacterium]|nr:KR domain-containing protein [Deltaproteobacteria bacterium]
MKKAILNNEFKEKKISPIQVEKSFKKYMANREIKQNIKKFESVGSKVKYYPIDILNKNSMIHAINEVKTIYGPISGIIHGAGVLADRLIA